LVDHEPLGAKGEFRDGLYALKAHCPGTKFVFGLRDIMDDVGRIQGQWRELGVYDALEHLYDGIAVYGSPALYDVADAYDIPAAVQPKLHYCGYVVRDPPALDPDRLRQELGLPTQGPLIVATVGSGSDGHPVLEATQGAVERLRVEVPELHAVMVTGPFMPAEQQAVRLARGRLMRFHFDPTPEQRAALEAQLARLQQPAAALELLDPILPDGLAPAAAVCTLQSVHSDRFVLQVRVRSRGGEERVYALKA